MTKILEMKKITKVFPNGFVANQDIDFDLNEGEIHALLGENGAGKSTLMKILFGFETPEQGEVFLRGEKVEIQDALDAISKGIGMVHQHFMLVPSLTVAENIVLGSEPNKGKLFDIEEAIRITNELSDKYNLPINPRSKVRDVSIGGQQRIEILKTLYRGADIIILDEPTAVLTPQETEKLFEQLLDLQKLGHTIVFISHKLDEVKQICDRFTILRKGRSIATGDVSEVSEQEISKLMVGRDVDLSIKKEDTTFGKPLLEIKKLEYINKKENEKMLDDFSLEIREGEIVGVAGIEGNGQSELSKIVTGNLGGYSGEVIINGQDIKPLTTREIRELGVAYIPEDRMTVGCAPDSSITDNIIADRYYFDDVFSSKGFLNKEYIKKHVDEKIKEYQVFATDQDVPVGSLSGGNIQKVVAAREMSSGKKVFVSDNLTRGIDVGAIEFLRNELVDKTREFRVAVLFISADLSEVIEVSDRLIVMRDGKIVAEFTETEKLTNELVGEYMLGIKEMAF